MGKKSSEELPFINENWEVNEQDLKYCLNDGDETNFLNCMEEIREEIRLWLANDLLTIFAQRKLQQAVKAILKKYLNVREAARKAVQNGYHVILGEWLKVEPEISHYFILSVCLKLKEPRKREINDTLLRSNLKMCLELMLKQINVDVGCIDIADISLVLSAYFNDCLKKIRNQTHENVIEFDYRCLMSHNIFSKQNATHRGTCETEVFLDIARNKNLNHLLEHPLLSSFLYHKWCKIRRILYTIIAFHGIFYFLLILIYESSPNENGTQTVNDSFVVLNSTLLIRFYPESLLQVSFFVLWLLFTIWEILIFACCPCRYFMNWENRLQVMLIIFTLILLCGAGAWSRFVVLLLWYALVLIMLNKQSVSFEIFRMSFLNYVRLLFPFMFLIVPFALAFYILIGNDEHFSNSWNSLFETLIMVFGEFNSNDISFVSHPVWSHITFVLLAIFISVFNIVISAVTNTEEIRSKAELNRFISHIHLIIYLENIAFGEPFSWFSRFSRGNSCLLRWKPFRFLRNIIFLFPHYLENGKITFAHADVIYSNSINYNKLSPNLEMDPDIIKKAERIISDQNQRLDNKRIALNNQQQQKDTEDHFRLTNIILTKKLNDIEDNLFRFTNTILDNLNNFK